MAGNVILGAIGWFFKWIWAIISYPVIFSEHLELLKEIKDLMLSPKRMDDYLALQERIYGYKIKEIRQKSSEQIFKVKKEERQKQETLIVDLERGKKETGELREKAKEMIKDIKMLIEAYKKRRDEVERLNKELEKAKLGKMAPLVEHPTLSSTSLYSAFLAQAIEKESEKFLKDEPREEEEKTQQG